MIETERNSSAHKKRILICDDDALFRKTLGLLLRETGSIVTTQNTDEALALLTTQSFDLLLLDVQMRTDDEGLRALPKIRAVASDMTIVMLSGRKDFATVRQALRAGADDYLAKDFEPDEFRLTIERALGKTALEKTNRKRGAETSRTATRYRLVGESPAIQEIRRISEKFRAASANVLIRGETGTGKEIVARLLRKFDVDGSPEPFVAIDSATLHSQTAESILFGHERGAFTGADRVKHGLFEEADGGIIFFDEIGNMPIEIQAKLLRVLQEREIVRLGSNRTISLEFRVVAATNRPLEAMAESGSFLPDLLQRLNVLPISLSPLRDRREDIPLLSDYFLEEKTGGRVKLSPEASDALTEYRWPGNVRELSALLEYSLALIEDDTIDLADLHPRVLETPAGRPGGADDFYAKMATFEAEILRAAYATEPSVSRLALKLGMDRSHLHTKLKLYGIHTAKAR